MVIIMFLILVYLYIFKHKYLIFQEKRNINLTMLKYLKECLFNTRGYEQLSLGELRRYSFPVLSLSTDDPREQLQERQSFHIVLTEEFIRIMKKLYKEGKYDIPEFPLDKPTDDNKMENFFYYLYRAATNKKSSSHKKNVLTLWAGILFLEFFTIGGTITLRFQPIGVYILPLWQDSFYRDFENLPPGFEKYADYLILVELMRLLFRNGSEINKLLDRLESMNLEPKIDNFFSEKRWCTSECKSLIFKIQSQLAFRWPDSKVTSLVESEKETRQQLLEAFRRNPLELL
jgi:hypothetical protein